jgi:hypothetical protein
MQPVISRLHRGLAWLILVGLAAEVYLVGTRLFGVTTLQPHRSLGYALGIAILLLLILTLVADRRRRIVQLATLLVALTIVQVVLPSLATSLPWVAALHAITTMALMGVTAAIARSPGAEPRSIEMSDGWASAGERPLAPSVRA